jgi:hypothetical protein
MLSLLPSLRPSILTATFGGFGLGDRLWDIAGRRPSLDLQLATTKSLTDSVTGASLVTFTRSSIGTYTDSAGVLQTAATNVPRFDHNPTTGESLGLLVEEERTNLLVRSEEFDDASWSKAQATLAANDVAAPDGTIAADKLIENSASGIHRAIQAYTGFTSGTAYTWSIYAKAAERSRIAVWGSNTITFPARTVFDLANGTIVSTTFGTASIQSLANGWYRCVVTGTAGATAPSSVEAVIVESGTTTNYTGDGTSGIYLWGAQLEAGAFPTTYIPTTTAAVTRTADVASITGSAFSSWYRQDEGTVFADCKVIGDKGSSQFIYSISDGALGDEIRLFKTSGNSSISNVMEDSVDGTTNNIFGNTNSPFGQSFKTAYAFANNYASRAVGGLASGVDNSVTVPAVNQIRIGARMNETFYSNLYLSRLTYWPTRLSNEVLQGITQ